MVNVNAGQTSHYYNAEAGQVYADAWEGDGTTTWDDPGDCLVDSWRGGAPGNYGFYRAGAVFDLSAESGYVTDCKLNLYGTNENFDDASYLHIRRFGGTIPATPSVVTGYNKNNDDGSDGGSIQDTAWNGAGGWNEIQMTPWMIGVVRAAIGGTLRLMLRNSRDIAGTPPSGLTKYSRYQFDGDVNLPYLDITYGPNPGAKGGVAQVLEALGVLD